MRVEHIPVVSAIERLSFPQPWPQNAYRREILEVKTGLLGLGKHLYIPLDQVQEVTQGCVFLSHPKDEIEGMGWSQRPDYLDELT